jgi:hypothetical protein
MIIRIAIAVTLVSVVAAAGGEDWPPRLVASFPAPPGAIALACEYEPLYALVGGATPTVFTLITWNGSITGSFNIPVPNGARGIATTGSRPTYLWVSNRLNRFLYRLDTTGSLLGSFQCPAGKPFGLGGYLHGGGPDRGYLTVSCRNQNQILRVNPTTGSLASSFPGPAAAVTGYDEGLAVDRYTCCLYWDYYGGWTVLDTLAARPWGVTTSVEGTTYGAACVCGYVLCHNGYIYRYKGTNDDAVAPASLGRVKALFR